jgi:hypothetical protein
MWVFCTLSQKPLNETITKPKLHMNNIQVSKHFIECGSGHWHIMPHLPKPIWGGAFIPVNDLPTMVGGASGPDMMSIQLLEKGEFQETKLKFNPDIAAENQRKYAVAVVAHERYVCF